MKDSFLKSTGFWGTAISQRTNKVTVKVIFPIDRPPLHVSIFENNTQRTQSLQDVQHKLPDGQQILV